MLDKSIHYSLKCALLAFVFCETLLISATAQRLPPYKNKKWVIVIDAGHGGKDPGCHGLKYKEKNVALAVALKLGRLLQENDKNVKVIYTRTTDVFIPLNERADIANRNHADFFICIHCNASPDKTKYGAATYVMGLYKAEGNLEVAKRENSSILYEKDYKRTYNGFDPNSDEANILFAMYQNAYLAQSLDLSAKIQKEYANAGRTDNGVKQAGFLVLWKTAMPSLLTEIGFLTNPKEELFIGSRKGQSKIAESLFFALQQYMDEKDDVTFNAGDFKLPTVQPDSVIAEDTTVEPADTSSKIANADTEKVQADTTAPAPNKISKKPSSKDADNMKALVQALHPDSTTHKVADTDIFTHGNKYNIIKRTSDSTTNRIVKTPDSSAAVHKTIKRTTDSTANVIVKTPDSSAAVHKAIKGTPDSTATRIAKKSTDSNAHKKTKTAHISAHHHNHTVIAPDSTITAAITADSSAHLHKQSIIKKPDDTAQIIYKVQFALSPKLLPKNDLRFKDVPGVEMYKDKSDYKYTSGHFSSLSDAIKRQSQLRNQGFKDAFVVAFKNNKRVPVHEEK